MKARRNPCYYCENRTATCRLECPEWAEYVKERDADYEKAAHDKERMYGEYQQRVHDRIEKHTKRKA